MSYEDKFDALLDLLRRLDPKHISKNLNDICTLIQQQSDQEDLVQDLLSSVDVPLQLAKCGASGKQYLCCDYNRDGDSYRSPWSNKYYPAVSGDDDELPPYPSDILRQLEEKANDSFDIYRDLYYEGSAVSLVYLWDTAEDDESPLEQGFAGVVLFKKEIDGGLGKWDSIHVFEVIAEQASKFSYKITSTVILDLANNSGLLLGGNLTRQLEHLATLESSQSLEMQHLVNLGTLVEKSEYNIRNLLQEVYFDKLKDIFLKDIRSVGDVGVHRDEKSKHSKLIEGLQGK